MQSISTLFEEFSFRPRKSQGQNFLADKGILDQIDLVVDCPEGDLLLEVGGGYGALTEKLLAKGRPLVVVEPDHKLFAMLEKRFGTQPHLSLLKADILKVDLATLAPPSPGKLTVAGNIPYYLTTPLITRLLIQFHPLVRKIYLMVQKEVADRMVAKPGTKAYGALTLCVQYYSRCEKKLDVPARCFRPAPKVDSAFVELELGKAFPLKEEDEKRLFQLIRAIFQGRRKILSNSLKSMGCSGTEIGEALGKVRLDPLIRGEKLALEKLIELSQALGKIQAPKG